MQKISTVLGEQRRKAVREAVDALGSEFVEKCRQAKRILIKPDLVHPELQLASVHVDAVRGVLDVIRLCSNAPIVIGDAAHFGTKAAFRHLGYERLLENYPTVELRDLQDDEFVEQVFPLANGQSMVMRRPKTIVESDLKICLSNLKTHKEYGASLTVSSWAEGTMLVPPRIGVLGRVWSRAPWLSVEGPAMTHRALAFLFEQTPCDVAVIDGILAMEGDGPVDGTSVSMGIAIAGFDAAAVDALGATLIGLDPHVIGYLENLAATGKWTNDISKINVPLEVLQLGRVFQLPMMTKEHLADWKNG